MAHAFQPHLLRSIRWFPWAILVAATLHRTHAAVDYATQIRPLLQERCFSCHGALKQKSNLRLDTVELMRRGGKSGPALVPGKPESSPILERVSAADPEDRMPPEHEGQSFSPTQVSQLREWIAAGAPAPADERPEADPREHWAFRPRTRPPVPGTAAQDPTRIRNPIDAFLESARATQQLTPLPDAPRALLVRRLYLDLIGLPPTEAERAAHLADSRPDWYERLVDRLLDDPRRGERWARHWMDIWRYSDSWGLGDQHRNSQKHLWHWRDWIVESINRDLPYDEMIRLMVAADELHPNDPDRLRATGFLARNYFLFNRNQWMDETIEHVGKGFLGITLNCAKCHDHKYDPFPQTDYYRLRAVFEPYHARLDILPGEPDLNRDGLPRVYDRTLDVPTWRFIRGQENAPDKSTRIEPGVPALLAFAPFEAQPVSLPPEAWQPERRSWVFEAYLGTASNRVAAARAQLDQTRTRLGSNTNAEPQAELRVAESQLSVAQADLTAIARRAAAQRRQWNSTQDANIERRAAVTAERQLAVARQQLALSESELKLVRAAADKKEAITKELATGRDKLTQLTQAAASEPAGGDTFTPLTGATWTATRFLDSTKDDPAAAFPSTSTGRRTALARWITDARNPLTARVAVNHLWNRHLGAPLAPVVFDFGRKSGTPPHTALIDWLASELVDHRWSLRHVERLILTSAAYRMDSSLQLAADRSARDPDNRLWWRRTPIRLEGQVVRDSILALAGDLESQQGGPPIAPSAQEESRRRSLYFYHSNNDRNLFLTTFDEALVKECYRREQSIVPQQSLALLNSRLVGDSAPRIARQLTARSPSATDESFVRQAFRSLLGYEPSTAELGECLTSLESWRQGTSTSSNPHSSSPADRARISLIWALLNHGDFVTLR
jgi:hypothetical protein